MNRRPSTVAAFVAVFFIFSGILWQLPTNWLLFIPVAAFWFATAGALALLAMAIFIEWTED